ncbi:uncharacterized protein LOC111297768 [Durio zibethinus]|uniref:Uncharacterized protein LOC111297768 n=1 Tax=Durio zibethinus TaxID=66656 RepID=A0A6P5Z5Y8_DURZI|nr:uncharacterized protein LOC111297768 [Durio zibethinus]
MEHQNIDWNNIESNFEEDDTYENIHAPKWVDLSAPCEPIDDEAWFCKPGCKHPKCAEDYLKSKHYTKVKLLKSMTISEIIPFRDRTRRCKFKRKGYKWRKWSKPTQSLNDDNENRNPNLSTPPLGAKTMPKKMAKKSSMVEKTQLDDLRDNSAKSDRKRRLKSTFSARNLVAGREILKQITEFCVQLKKMASKGSEKRASEKASDGVLGELKERVRENERMPLLLVKEREV